MASTPYDRQTSFALFSAENPNEQHSGATLDAEFNAVKLAIDDTQQNLALIQDADGAVKRGSIGKEQFDASVSIGFGAPSQWASGQIYTADVDTVFYLSKFYIAKVTHTSGVSFVLANWTEIADFTLAAVIADGSITSAKLATGAVTADKIGSGSISNDKLASGAVTAGKIAGDAVTTTKILDANVTTPKIADLNVTTAKLAADAVTYAKMQNVAASRLLGNPTGGAADPSEISLDSTLAFTGSALKVAPGIGITAALDVAYATKAEQQAGTSTVKAIQPARQQDHPSAAKVWVYVLNSLAIQSSYGVTNVTRAGVGDYTVNFSTPFTVLPCCVVSAVSGASIFGVVGNIGLNSVGVNFRTSNTAALVDPTAFTVECFGTQ